MKKHKAHIRHLGGIEVGEIKGGEITHAIKHIAHIRHLGGIEIREIYL